MRTRSNVKSLFLLAATLGFASVVRAQRIEPLLGTPFSATWTGTREVGGSITTIKTVAGRARDGRVYRASYTNGALDFVEIIDVPHQKRFNVYPISKTYNEVTTPTSFWTPHTAEQVHARLETTNTSRTTQTENVKTDTTPLEMKTVDGMTIYGRHVVETRGQDVVLTGDSWMSDFGFLYSHRIEYPDRKTIETLTLNEMKRDEPDASLFVIPSGYRLLIVPKPTPDGSVVIQASTPSSRLTGGINVTYYHMDGCPLAVTIEYAFLPQSAINGSDAFQYCMSHIKTQLSGGSAWVHDKPYDISLRMKSDSSIPNPTPTDYEPMRAKLREALAQQFHLAVHIGQTETNGYALEFEKQSSKLVASNPNKVQPSNSTGAKGIWSQVKLPNGAITLAKSGPGSMSTTHDSLLASYKSFTDTTMATLANVLSSNLDAPVVDQTGLAGPYDFTLKYEATLGGIDRFGDIHTDGQTPLVEELGLRLRKVKVPKDIVVIDRIDGH